MQKMNKGILMFGDTEIEFPYSKHPLDRNNVDIDKIIISNKVSFGKEDFKYFMGYKDDE